MSNNSNPALSQILTKVTLKPNTLGHPQFFEVVPHFKQNGLVNIDVDQMQEYGASINGIQVDASQSTLTPRVRCWNGDRTLLVQLLPDTMVVNKVGTDFEWADFKDFFAMNLASLKTGLGDPRVKSLALKTVYEFFVPRRKFDLDKYLKLGVSGIEDWCKSSDESLDFSFASGRLKIDNHNRQLRLMVQPSKGKFQIKVFSVFHDRILEQGTDLVDLLENLYVQSENGFESLLTEKTRTEIIVPQATKPVNGV